MAALPFVAIGMLGQKLILILSLVVGGIGLAGMILGCLLKPGALLPKLGSLKLQDYFLPYVLALSSAILESHGIAAASGYWLALADGLLTLIVSFIPDNPDRR